MFKMSELALNNGSSHQYQSNININQSKYYQKQNVRYNYTYDSINQILVVLFQTGQLIRRLFLNPLKCFLRLYLHLLSVFHRLHQPKNLFYLLYQTLSILLDLRFNASIHLPLHNCVFDPFDPKFDLQMYSISSFTQMVYNKYSKSVTIGHSLRNRFIYNHELFMTDPIKSLFKLVYTSFRHEWYGTWFHRMNKGGFSGGVDRTVLKTDVWLHCIKSRSWFIIFFICVFMVSTFLTQIDQKIRFLSSIEIEGYITVKNIVKFINSYSLESMLNQQQKLTCILNFRLNKLSSFLNLYKFVFRKNNLRLSIQLFTVAHQAFLMSLFQGLDHTIQSKYLFKPQLSFMSANDQKLFEHFILFSNFIDLFPRDNQIQLLTAELKTIDFNCKYTILLIFSIHESTIVHLQLSAILYLGIFLYLLYKFCYLLIVIFIVFEIYLNL